ncbi:hypothetical protein ES706_01550 [subsurface metagenome]|nr:hypothetical protein [Hadesarchaea archaeon]
MSIGWKFIYYFDGSDSKCALCRSMTGWYADRPSKPHPNCDCSIKRYVRFGRYEIRDIQEDMVDYTELWGMNLYLENNKDFPIPIPSYEVVVKKTMSWEIKADFEKYVGLKGSGSIVKEQKVSIPALTLPPHSFLRGHVQITRVTTHYRGTKYFVFTFAGEYKEIKIGTVSGGTKQDDDLFEAKWD